MTNITRRLAILGAVVPLWLAVAIPVGVRRDILCVPFVSARCNDRTVTFLTNVLLLQGLSVWQALIAGVLAIVAAVVGGMFIHAQMQQAQRQEEERLKRSRAAARAMLPLVLSSLTEYASHVAEGLCDLYRQAAGELIPHSAVLPEFPTVPAQTIAEMKSTIETSEPALEATLASILANVQVLSARLRGLRIDLPQHGNAFTLHNLQDYILGAAEIYAAASALFDFARKKVDEVPQSIDLPNIQSALNNMGFFGQRYDGLRALAERRYQ